MNIRKTILYFLSLILVSTGFAENITLENQTSYPVKGQSKIAIQWAGDADEIDRGNAAFLVGTPLNSTSLQYLNQQGQIVLNVPNGAEYFRIVAWSKESQNPDLLTNWIELEPNKTYTLKQDQLVPAVLMSGFGC